jgi:hypothetical protein
LKYYLTTNTLAVFAIKSAHKKQGLILKEQQCKVLIRQGGKFVKRAFKIFSGQLFT